MTADLLTTSTPDGSVWIIPLVVTINERVVWLDGKSVAFGSDLARLPFIFSKIGPIVYSSKGMRLNGGPS